MTITKIYIWSVRDSEPVPVRFVKYSDYRQDIAECSGVLDGRKYFCFISDMKEQP